MPQKTMAYLKMCCTIYPMVLSVNYLIKCNDTLE